MRKNILVTGGCGFIGSNFIINHLEAYSEVKITNLDSLTYASDEDNLSTISKHPNYKFVFGNICDDTFINFLFRKNKFDALINFAAESHVDNSISNPENFIRTNIQGTFNLLEAIRKNKYCRFIQISTDEVYGSLDNKKDLFSETTPYNPSSPYSASKASADMLVKSYYHTYGLDLLITNCSNNYGPRQHKEKLIPKIIYNALNNLPIPIYGDGSNIRDWLYVDDHVNGIDLVLRKGVSGESYNIGGNNEFTNNEIVNIICNHLDMVKPKLDGKTYASQVEYVDDRLGHDKRYGIDATKIRKDLKWIAEHSFKTGIEKTVEWYIKKYNK